MPTPNPRKLITAHIATTLKTPDASDPPVFPTPVGGRVSDNDATPPDADGLNEINVVFVKETIDEFSQHQDGRRRRIMTVQIECYNSAGKDAVDDIAWAVEEAMRANPTLGNMVESTKFLDIGFFVVENSTDAMYCMVMTYEIIYWTHVVEEDGIPVTILLGFDPYTGPGNEDEYIDVTGNGPTV